MVTFNDLVIEAIRNRKPLQAPAISLVKMLEISNTQAFLKSCTERIFDTELFDNDSIKIDIDIPYNLMFTAKGLIRAEDILKSYVSDEKLKEFTEDLIDYDAIIKAASNLAHLLSRMNLSTLRMIAHAKYNGLPLSNITEDMQICATEELKQRNPFRIIGRNIRYIAENIRTLIKYRRVILFTLFHSLILQE